MRKDTLEGELEYKINNIKDHEGIGVDVNLFNDNHELAKSLVFVAYADDLDKFILAYIFDFNYEISKQPEDIQLIGLELTKDELIEFGAQPNQGVDVFYTFPDKDIARGKAARK